MGKINILTKEIFNRIAAGEVVDRPYSAVKELIENALDAGATEISVYVEKGGRQLIRVCDNGGGIEPDDMRKAFIPHATSKVAKVEDLDSIATLGFRGEALASISSISRTEITSKTESNPACRVLCEGGYIGKVEPAALDRGTEVAVHDLFYNTPARAKFLKSDKAEEGDIHNFVSRFILGNPDVSFKYYSDGKLKLQSFGNGLDEAVTQVYGAKVIPNCYKINAEKNGIKIHGFIGNQNFFKPNKRYQSLFLNGRYIVNSIVSSAITNAYASYLMKRQYPFYVLFLDVPAEMVDVNVHPNKADVRFTDGRAVYGAVYSVISGILDGTARAADFVVDYARIPEIRSSMPVQTSIDEGATQGAEVGSGTGGTEGGKAVQAQPKEPDLYGGDLSKEKPESSDGQQSDSGYLSYEEVLSHGGVQEKSSGAKAESAPDYSAYENYAEPKFEDREKTYPVYAYYSGLKEKNVLGVSSPTLGISDSLVPSSRQKKAEEQEKFVCRDFTYKGNLFNTYLLYEIGGEVYIIDQHAAHERLIYDRFRKQVEERKVARQGMLVPYIISLTPEENSFMEENLMLIREMGFDIEPFGINAYRVCEVPADLKNLDFAAFFNELLSDVSGLKSIKMADVLKDKIAMAACKHAVKGGMELTRQEADGLLAEMHGDMGLKCPHGRPVAVKLTKYQIEKMFKRIV